jgi:NADH:ubiquinone oxidoreductase subunit 6 (subunit J)
MMDERAFGLIVALIGAVVTAVAALANPLGIGETEVFGWLQWTGVIVGIVVILLGLAFAMAWVPYPWGRTDTAAGATQNTTIVESRDRSA